MNFVFVSPQFPASYWNFCDRLKQRGVTVLGLSDAPYDSLSDQVKNSLTEYYRVDNMGIYGVCPSRGAASTALAVSCVAGRTTFARYPTNAATSSVNSPTAVPGWESAPNSFLS